ncbi:hypothetical protein SynBIOSE41_00920 [Synechococcus sp. BIOS-E4-1]|nr:hypothetical protein SynBIOSE41_00920 [Synechococcus sp. BIOS-E4-1]
MECVSLLVTPGNVLKLPAIEFIELVSSALVATVFGDRYHFLR